MRSLNLGMFLHRLPGHLLISLLEAEIFTARWKPISIILLSETGGGEEGKDIMDLLRELLFLLQWIFQVMKMLASSCYSANKCWPLQHNSKFTVVKAVSLSSMTFWVTAAKKALIPYPFIWELWFHGGFLFLWGDCSQLTSFRTDYSYKLRLSVLLVCFSVPINMFVRLL